MAQPLAGLQRWLAVAFYAAIGGAFTIRLAWTLTNYPLTAWALNDAEWSTAWLITTILDYYVVAFCVSGFVIATEATMAAILWVALINLLGAPFACAYVVIRLNKCGTLALSSAGDESRAVLQATETGRRVGRVAMAFYSVIGLAFFMRLSWTLVTYPIFPPKTDDAAWASAWLITTIGDFYTVSAVFCGIVMYTEGAIGVAWSLALLLLGCPFACIYMVKRVLNGQSLELDELESSSDRRKESQRLCW
eukprot:TRINITY_DN98426_c0_g1_i1.p1 TRINITY_DN98426_c0_g1~~TRINITY_DN98426_c0_g1_i1.p1  ORF type:complete len:249 (+),score=30.72 TRINITY_DN98426_c0_g1_i1:62-808(+)